MQEVVKKLLKTVLYGQKKMGSYQNFEDFVSFNAQELKDEKLFYQLKNAPKTMQFIPQHFLQNNFSELSATFLIK